MDDVMDERLPDQEIWVKAIAARQNESRWRVTDGSSTFEVHVEKDVLDRLKQKTSRLPAEIFSVSATISGRA
jgi:beta-glucosidase/6-phospho-beta-glucosidase/beta-galactosidase